MGQRNLVFVACGVVCLEVCIVVFLFFVVNAQKGKVKIYTDFMYTFHNVFVSGDSSVTCAKGQSVTFNQGKWAVVSPFVCVQQGELAAKNAEYFVHDKTGKFVDDVKYSNNTLTIESQTMQFNLDIQQLASNAFTTVRFPRENYYGEAKKGFVYDVEHNVLQMAGVHFRRDFPCSSSALKGC